MGRVVWLIRLGLSRCTGAAGSPKLPRLPAAPHGAEWTHPTTRRHPQSQSHAKLLEAIVVGSQGQIDYEQYQGYEKDPRVMAELGRLIWAEQDRIRGSKWASLCQQHVMLASERRLSLPPIEVHPLEPHLPVGKASVVVTGTWGTFKYNELPLVSLSEEVCVHMGEAPRYAMRSASMAAILGDGTLSLCCTVGLTSRPPPALPSPPLLTFFFTPSAPRPPSVGYE